MPIKHPFVSAKPDGGDAALLQPSSWNADHVVDVVAPTGLTGATAASRYVGGTASGAPASGTFAIGDFVIDRTGKIYICTVAGTPGTWSAVSGGSGMLAHNWSAYHGLGWCNNTTPSTVMSVTFTVPSSGSVAVAVKGWGVLTSGYTPYFCIYNGVSLVVEGTTFQGGGNQTGYLHRRWTITSLTPGASLTWTWKNRTDGGGTFQVFGDYATAEMEIWAL